MTEATIHPIAPDNMAFMLSRMFDAPREKVFAAWTNPEHLAQWWGPKGCKIRVAQLEVKPGGVFHYAMGTPDGNEMWGKFVYREVQPPEKLVFVNSFSDADGNVTRAPFPQLGETWPLEVLNTLTLTDQNGKTLLQMRGLPINTTDVENETFVKNHPGMQHGWAGTMEVLEEFLAR